MLKTVAISQTTGSGSTPAKPPVTGNSRIIAESQKKEAK